MKFMDTHLDSKKRRSAGIEKPAEAFPGAHRRRERDRRDLEIINRLSEKLNSEADDVLIMLNKV